ncbi:MAG: DUF2391 family protein [Bdellovibrionota bacterium]|nr:DUF2391 family protein [Deltaproteobacteria bacterium]
MPINKHTFQSEVQRINGYLKEVVTQLDHTGKPISSFINPLMVELRPRDILQIFVGSFLIAAPLAFTEEIWNLSQTISSNRIWALGCISLVTVTLFIYFNFYRNRLKGYWIHFIKRVVATYLITCSSAIGVLFLIEKLPIHDQPQVAINRVIIISFPAVFAAVISDYLK